MEASRNDLSTRVEQLSPKISITILFGPHKTEADVRPLEDKFKTADIYIPETIGWSSVDLELFKSVAEGKNSPAQLFQNLGCRRIDYQYHYAMLGMVKNSRKPIVFIDVPLEHENLEVFLRNQKEFKIQESFDDQLRLTKATFKDEAKLQIEREAYMKSMLPIKIKEALNEYPELKKKDTLNILISLGTLHANLYGELKKAGYDVKKEEMPSYGYSYEGFNAYKLGKEMSDELAAKIFLELTFKKAYRRVFDGLTGDHTDRLHLMQKIISQFSFEEAREIFEVAKRGENLGIIFDSKLRSKGIKFPQSGRQLEYFLKN